MERHEGGRGELLLTQAPTCRPNCDTRASQSSAEFKKIRKKGSGCQRREHVQLLDPPTAKCGETTCEIPPGRELGSELSRCYSG